MIYQVSGVDKSLVEMKLCWNMIVHVYCINDDYFDYLISEAKLNLPHEYTLYLFIYIVLSLVQLHAFYDLEETNGLNYVELILLCVCDPGC